MAPAEHRSRAAALRGRVAADFGANWGPPEHLGEEFDDFHLVEGRAGMKFVAKNDMSADTVNANCFHDGKKRAELRGMETCIQARGREGESAMLTKRCRVRPCAERTSPDLLGDAAW